MRSRCSWLLACAFAAGLSAAPALAADPSKFTPADAELVMVLNVKQILGSQLLKQYNVPELLQGMIAGNEEAKQIIQATGLDPLKDIDSVMLTGAGNTPDKVLVVVKGNFNADKIQKALTAQKDKVTMTKEGALTVYEIKTDQTPAFATVLDKNTILAGTSKDYVVAAPKNTGAVGKELKAALGKFTGNESLYIAAKVTDELRQQLGANEQLKEIAPKLLSAAASFN